MLKRGFPSMCVGNRSYRTGWLGGGGYTRASSFSQYSNVQAAFGAKVLTIFGSGSYISKL